MAARSNALPIYGDLLILYYIYTTYTIHICYRRVFSRRVFETFSRSSSDLVNRDVNHISACHYYVLFNIMKVSVVGCVTHILMYI